jgi:hypothetical protein
MISNNKIKVGDQVIIHHYIADENKNKNLINGRVLKIEESEDLSHHGSPWYEECYTVKGDDGRIYFGTYNMDYLRDGYCQKTYFTKVRESHR